jgi:hypothetical protein
LISIPEKLDVVYPLAAGPDGSSKAKGPDDFELRYSLRSLAEQSWVGNVFIVSQRKPSWLKNAYCIEHKDEWNTTSFKDKNLIKKMLRACTDERVSDPFVANSDDQFWLKPIDPIEMLIPPREHPSQVEQDLVSKGRAPIRAWKNAWVKRQFETVNYLKKMGKCPIYFEGHVPYIIHKDCYIKTMCQIPWEMGEGFLIVVYHGWNWEFLKYEDFKIENRDGVLKRIRTATKLEKIKEGTARATFLNINGKALTGDDMTGFLKERFPNPSPWE